MRKKIGQQLLEAIGKGDTSLCRDLLERGADVNVADENGWNALHVAAWNSRANVCLLLLEQGADIDAVDSKGYSALHKASIVGCMAACLLLLDQGANLSAKNNNGQTVLGLALRYQNHACARAMRAWVTADAARAALQEIVTTDALKMVSP